MSSVMRGMALLDVGGAVDAALNVARDHQARFGVA